MSLEKQIVELKEQKDLQQKQCVDLVQSLRSQMKQELNQVRSRYESLIDDACNKSQNLVDEINDIIRSCEVKSEVHQRIYQPTLAVQTIENMHIDDDQKKCVDSRSKKRSLNESSNDVTLCRRKKKRKKKNRSLSGEWFLYFDNSVYCANLSPNDEETPLNEDRLFLSHNRETNEISGFVCTPLRCHVAGHVAANDFIRLLMIWSPNPKVGGQFAGYVTVINAEYDGNRMLNSEYCSFHCINFFQNTVWRRMEKQFVDTQNRTMTLDERQQMALRWQAEVSRIMEKGNDGDEYVSIVLDWFHENDGSSVSPGEEKDNSNQCIWLRKR